MQSRFAADVKSVNAGLACAAKTRKGDVGCLVPCAKPANHTCRQTWTCTRDWQSTNRNPNEGWNQVLSVTGLPWRISGCSHWLHQKQLLRPPQSMHSSFIPILSSWEILSRYTVRDWRTALRIMEFVRNLLILEIYGTTGIGTVTDREIGLSIFKSVIFD